MNKDEALKMVIKNLELQEFNTVNATLIAYCKEALATNKDSSLVQPAQNLKLIEDNGNGIKTYEILPTHQWQGLTDDEVDDFMFQSCDAENGYSITDLIRLVEQALKEKNHEP
jgi:hypothetical protein